MGRSRAIARSGGIVGIYSVFTGLLCITGIWIIAFLVCLISGYFILLTHVSCFRVCSFISGACRCSLGLY